MKLWLIFMQEERGDYMWLEAAWDDESTAHNSDGWDKEVKRCRDLAHENNYAMRIASTEVPGAYELFDLPSLAATRAEETK